MELVNEFLEMMEKARRIQGRHYGDIRVTKIPCGCVLISIVGERNIAFKDACARHNLLRDDILRAMKKQVF
jgi:hypothetical protein